MNGIRIEVDDRKLVADTKQLTAGIERKVAPAANRTANDTAERLRQLVPVDTGALQATVQVIPVANGAEIHYGGNLRYAKFHQAPADQATVGVEAAFTEAMRLVAAGEVRKI